MLWNQAITAHELRALLFRGGGIVASSVAGIIALKAFLRFDQADAAVLIALLGFLVFMPLAQMGFGKPCYGEIRERFIANTLRAELTGSFLGLFGWQSGAAALLFALLGVGLALRQGYSFSLISLFVFTWGQAALGACAYQRDLSYALSCDPIYENWEFVRRCTSLISFITVLIGWPLWVGGCLCLVSAYISQLWIAKHLRSISTPSSNVSPETHYRELRPRLGANARKYLAFSLNELLFYNMPLLVFTWMAARSGIIYFGIWSKLFMLTVLPMRMVADARVNRQTMFYFGGDTPAVWTALIHSLQLALIIVITGITIVFTMKPTLLRWVGASLLNSDFFLVPSIAIWGVGNAIQHVFGSFTVSYRNGFRFALKASLFSLVTVGSVFILWISMGQSSGSAMFAAGIAYFFCTWIYVHHVRELLGTATSPIGGNE